VADRPIEDVRPAGGTATAKPKVRRPNGRVALLGPVELSIVLGLLDILFLAFVLVQFRYLFGGAELVRVSTSLTYAEYARRGFFELHFEVGDQSFFRAFDDVVSDAFIKR
jgi:hypothetical protein